VKKLIVSSVLASSILFPTFANADNLSFPVKMTVEKKVDIRRGATTSFSIVKSLNSGQGVKVIGEFTNSHGQKWFHVDLGKIKGWGLSTLFTPESDGVVSSANVNVRRGATTSYETVGKLSAGTKIKVLDSFTNKSGELWYRIQYEKTTGWVIGKYLKTNFGSTLSLLQNLSSQKTVIVNNTYVRRGATTSYKTVLTLKKGQKVNIISHFTNSDGEKWYRVQSDQIIGWVISTAFETVDSTSQTHQKSVIIDKAYILRGASSSYQSVSTLVKGQTVNIIGTFSNSIGEKWYRAQYGKITGWIVSSAFEITQVKSTLLIGTKNTALYSGPSYKNSQLQRLPYNSKVLVLGETKDSSSQLWEKVKTESGKTGWTPKFELIQSNNDLHYVYTLNKAVIRKGASANYGIALSLKPNDKLMVLQTINGWVNVETNSGIRGWMLASQTSPVPVYGLLSPSVENNDLVWQKAMDYKISYSKVSSNQLKIAVATTTVKMPSFKMKGIKSIQSHLNGSNTSINITFEPGYTFTLRNYQDKLSIKVLPSGLLGKKIIVDAGHGGYDTGAIGPNGLNEKDVNLGTALLLKSELEKAGAIVTLTRSTDVFVELDERAAISNLSDADTFISIHSDSFSTTSIGTTTYFNTTVNFNGPKSKELAGDIEQNMISTLNTYNRGIKEQDYRVLRKNELPSILVELAYISNPKEEALLKSNDFRQKAAIGIRKGLEQYFSNL
jgi:N-acetylmuramoyl-L-alanine amidase